MSHPIYSAEERQAMALERLADVAQLYLVGALDLSLASMQITMQGGLRTDGTVDPIGDLMNRIGDLRDQIKDR